MEVVEELSNALEGIFLHLCALGPYVLVYNIEVEVNLINEELLIELLYQRCHHSNAPTSMDVTVLLG